MHFSSQAIAVAQMGKREFSTLQYVAGGSCDECNFVMLIYSPTEQHLQLPVRVCTTVAATSWWTIEKYIEFHMRQRTFFCSLLIIVECNFKCISTHSTNCKFQFNLHAHYNLWINFHDEVFVRELSGWILLECTIGERFNRLPELKWSRQITPLFN